MIIFLKIIKTIAKNLKANRLVRGPIKYVLYYSFSDTGHAFQDKEGKDLPTYTYMNNNYPEHFA